MPLEAETPYLAFTGNGSATDFDHVDTFTLSDPSHLHVYVDGTEVTTGFVQTSTGVAFDTAPAAAASIILRRVTPLEQPMTTAGLRLFSLATITALFDRVVRCLQDLAYTSTGYLARSLRVPDGETAAQLPAATLRAGDVLYFNATTGAVETKTPNEILALSGGAPSGIGIPAGGTTGQALVKTSSTDYAVTWSDTTPTAAGVLTALQAMTTAQEVSAWDALQTGADVQGTADLVNSQPWCMARINAWTTGTAAPLRGLLLGDSLAEVGGNFGLGPNMASAGLIGLQTYNVTGTVTNHTYPSTGRADIWINGRGTTFAIGSSAEFTSGGSATGNIRGDRACIGYIAGPGKGSFDLQYQANGTGPWTTLATINTANATTIGVWATYTLPSTNFPYYRLRVNNVITGIVELAPLTGIYNSTGGGVISMPCAMSSGLDLATHVAATPDAVFTPLWTGLAPDYVVSIWADAAAEWDSGGAFRAFYARANAAKSQTDWIQISRNPSSEPEGIPYSIAIAKAQATSQRAWALETKNTFLNGHEIHGGSYTVANARGLMNDVVHLSTAGATHRNACLWPKLPLGQGFLQGGGKIGQNSSFIGEQLSASTFLQALQFTVPLEVTGTTGAVRARDQAAPLDGTRIGSWQVSARVHTWTLGSSLGMSLNQAIDGSAALTPGFSGMPLGNTSLRWDLVGRNVSFNGTLIQVPDALSGAGAIPITTTTTAFTSTGMTQALTLANGTHGQVKTIVHDVDGGSAILTPTTKTGFTTVTFNNAGDTVTLQYFTTRGWMVIGSFGAVIA